MLSNIPGSGGPPGGGGGPNPMAMFAGAGGGGNPMAALNDLKGMAADLLDSDSIRSIYDKITSNASLKGALQGLAGDKFSTIDTIVHVLFPSKPVVYFFTTISIAVMIIAQAVVIFELLRINRYCSENTNLKAVAAAAKLCLIIAFIMVGIEFLTLLYMIRTGNTFSRHQMRYFMNWNIILTIAQFGLVGSLSGLWNTSKNSSAFINSVASTPNFIPSVSASISFSVSLNVLLTVIVSISWAYLCGLDSLLMPFLHEAQSLMDQFPT